MIRKSSMFVPSMEPGAQLQIVVARPDLDGPLPTIIFNHGSTGGGANTSFYSRTVCPAVVQNYFVQRGWMVLFPQRRGRGKSGGQYAEGLAADGSGYSCEPDIAMKGFERAIEDIDAVMTHVRMRADVDFKRLAIGGASRGGILSIAYAGMRSMSFRGAINFNGGWVGRACPAYETINPQIFAMGAAADISTLWLHGSYDQYYRIAHCRKNFERYISLGGKGVFVAAPGGHCLIFKPQLWKQSLDAYVEAMERDG